MTPEMLAKLKELANKGATIVGPPPQKSPSLVDYPRCDQAVADMAEELWGGTEPPAQVQHRPFGLGQIVWGGDLVVTPPGKPKAMAIEQARWIWFPEGNPAAAAEPATSYFRRRFTIPEGKKVLAARLEMTADNACEAWLNGKPAGQADNFHVVVTSDVRDLLRPGDNLLAVEASNSSDAPNPAGLIASLHIEYADGQSTTLVTDGRWQTAQHAPKNWRGAAIMPNDWMAAIDLGPVGIAPWNLKPQPESCPDLYPPYEPTTQLLAETGLAPDFESDGPIRYTHRRAKGWDLYFVSNRQSEELEAECTFRATDHPPELWNPVTGEIRDLPDYRVAAGQTVIPIRFSPHQSFFVFFRDGRMVDLDLAAPPAKNFSRTETIGTVAGPWQVSFDPEAGGPGKVTFPNLDDWTRHSEPGVKYYSGIATYQIMFDDPKSGSRSGRVFLNLGLVHSMARVRLNGQDLGVVWCAPWQVDVTEVLQEKDNRLEIDVANRWPNRLIGDQALPPKKRIGWTTFQPYKANSHLLPSGLLGPVTLRREIPPKP